MHGLENHNSHVMRSRINVPIKESDWLPRFLRHSHRRNYPPKSTIIHEGDKPESLYYIISGSVSVVIEDKEGRDIVLAYLNPGRFAEVSSSYSFPFPAGMKK